MQLCSWTPWKVWAYGLPITFAYWAWLQPFAWALPSTYVFEGMRTVLFTGVFRSDYFFTALVLDTFYVGLGAAVFFVAFHNARRRGALLQMGE